MTYWVKNGLLRTSLIVAYLYLGLLANGRAAMAISIVVALAVILLARSSYFSKAASIIVALLGAGLLYSSEVGQELISKINDDGGSNQKRFDALTWFSQNYESFIFTGYPGNRDLRGSGQLSSSLENAYLMAGLDYGLIFSGILLSLQFYIVVRNLRNRSAYVMGLAAAGVVVVNMTNSGFISNSISAYLIWIALGLCSVGTWITPNGYLSSARSPRTTAGA